MCRFHYFDYWLFRGFFDEVIVNVYLYFVRVSKWIGANVSG